MKLPNRITLDNVKVWHAKNLSHWISVKYLDKNTQKMVYCERSLGVIDKDSDILEAIKSKVSSLNKEIDKGNSIKKQMGKKQMAQKPVNQDDYVDNNAWLKKMDKEEPYWAARERSRWEESTQEQSGMTKQNEINYKFNEANLINELQDYINNTYGEHYSKNKFQSTEFIIDCGHGEGFALGNVLKYVQRYGNKDGYNRKDLLKVLHYALIALHNHDTTRT